MADPTRALRSHENLAGCSARIRIAADGEDAEITPDELTRHGVLITADRAGDGTTVDLVTRMLPWMELWTDHESWRTGAWRCVVDPALDQPQYTAYRPKLLQFHTDMSRYVIPPEFTVIRCTVPDPLGGGANQLLHIDDVLARLTEIGRTDVVDMLGAPRALNTEARHRNRAGRRDDEEFKAQLAVRDDARHPSRIFDQAGASKGSHLAMSAREQQLYEDFLQLCGDLEDIAVRVTLGRGDVLVFSNWRLLHAREECLGAGRTTEICMGNVPGWSQ